MKKNRFWKKGKLELFLSAVLFLFGFGDVFADGQYDTQLVFDPMAFTTVKVTVDGSPVEVHQYKIVYVANPVKMSPLQPGFSGGKYIGDTLSLPDDQVYIYQTMFVSVPNTSVYDQNTAIYLKVSNGGWKPTKASTIIANGKVFVSVSDTDNFGAALKAGYIIVEAGTRSRELRGSDGNWVGKSPATVVDTKAVIRYLRLNDSVMPGSAERIIITGTSGGGALSVAVAASGNSSDYCSYLEEIGAAGVIGSGESCTSTIRDDVFATVAYCPINNLGNSDIAYEWQYNRVRKATNKGALNGIAYRAGSQLPASAAIAKSFPQYLNSLNLKLDNKTTLNADRMPGKIVAQVKAEVERQIAKGTPMPAIGDYITANGKQVLNDWLSVEDGVVTNIDYVKYLNFVATSRALKTVVAFDACGVMDNVNITGESTLFGSAVGSDGSPTNLYSNFSEWSWNNNNNASDDVGFDETGFKWSAWIHHNSLNDLAKQLKMVNPIDYLNTKTADAAPYWYIRHGMVDRDTAFAIQIILYYAVKNDPMVADVNFKLPWMVGHSGNYDVQEAFTWIKAKLDANP